MKGKTEDEVQRYAKVFKERWKELKGKDSNTPSLIYDYFSAIIYGVHHVRELDIQTSNSY